MGSRDAMRIGVGTAATNNDFRTERDSNYSKRPGTMQTDVISEKDDQSAKLDSLVDIDMQKDPRLGSPHKIRPKAYEIDMR